MPSAELIGKWIDEIGTFFRQEIRIVEEGGKFYRLSSFHDGSSSRSELREAPAGTGERRRFLDPGSGGEFYVINANGDLELYDTEDYIRTARKDGG